MLVDIKDTSLSIFVDLKYATADNFTNEIIYTDDKCLIHIDVVEKLLLVQIELIQIGLSLKIWDAFRPLSAQWKFWEIIDDERFVSDPRKGGRHTRGTAIDVTLCDINGIELKMPSIFDDFSEKADRGYIGSDADLESIENRNLLQKVMEKNGFIGLPSEWWHFDLIGWENYPLIEG
eukprot:gene5680-7842_t